MPNPISKFDQSGLAVAIASLCLAITVFFWPVFFQGKVIVPGDIPNNDPFISDIAQSRALPQNPILIDQIEQFYIWHRIAANSLASEGKLPLWNPYIYSGQPLLANYQSAFFYPPNLLLHFLSPGKVATIRCFFNLMVAGVFTFLFCRELKISCKGALLSAFAFAFSGPFIVWLGHPHANVLAMLPFLMWAGERLIQKVSCLWIVILASGLGMSILGGHPETVFHTWLVFTLYFIARVIFLESTIRKKWHMVASVVTAAILGLTISGAQLLPFLDFLFHSSTLAHGGRSLVALGGNPFYSDEWTWKITSMLTLICPNFFGNPVDYNYILPVSTMTNFNEQAIYFGTIPLILVSGALFSDTRRGIFIIIAFLALFCTVVAFRFPVFEVVNHLPLFSMVNNTRLKLPFVFLAAVLAGSGLDFYLNSVSSVKTHHNKQLYIGAAILLATILPPLVIGIIKLSPLATVAPPGTAGHSLMYSVFTLNQLKTFIPAACAIALAISYFYCRKSHRHVKLMQIILTALTVLELFVLGWGYNPSVNEADILPDVAPVRFLKSRESQPYRILKTDGLFSFNYNAAYGIDYVGGYDLPVYRDYTDLYRAQGGLEEDGDIHVWYPDWALVDLLNVKYIISRQNLESTRFRSVYRAKNYNIYENMDAFPRAFMVFDYEVIGNRDAILEKMVNRKVDFSKRVIFEKEPIGLVTDRSDATGQYSVEVVKYATDEAILSINCTKPGFLVMSDLYTPDWQAQIDNQSATLYRANYAFRALLVPEGRHIVSFSYKPISYRIGLLMTVTGLIVAACLVLGSLVRNFRRAAGRT